MGTGFYEIVEMESLTIDGGTGIEITGSVGMCVRYTEIPKELR